jgi:hypothetical protein
MNVILKVEHDLEQCAHIFQRLKPLAKSFGAKQSDRNSYTIPKGPLEKKNGE